MEIKDYITIGIGVLGVLTGIAGLIFGIYQHKKTKGWKTRNLA